MLRKQYKKAVANGYHAGESVFGASYFISAPCLQALNSEGLLPDERLRTVYLEEDHIFSLLVKAAGFHLHDLSAGNLPFGCDWKELPDSPENLVANGKRIIHSTRRWKQMNEDHIRQYFREQRKEANRNR